MEKALLQKCLQVKDIAGNSKCLAGAQAQALLNAYYGYQYFVSPKRPTAPEERSAPLQQEEPAGKTLSVFPNPSKGNFTFRYNLLEDLDGAKLTLTDAQGRVLLEQWLPGWQGSFAWNAPKGLKGVVFYQLVAGVFLVETGKLVIIR